MSNGICLDCTEDVTSDVTVQREDGGSSQDDTQLGKNEEEEEEEQDGEVMGQQLSNNNQDVTCTICSDKNSDDSIGGTCTNNNIVSQPSPKFAVKQRVLARDTDTPLLYDAVVRKQIYAPKSTKVHVGRIQLPNPDDEPFGDNNNNSNEQQLDDLLRTSEEDSKLMTWHYFVHYQGWNVKWDRWVQEDSLFEDKEDTRILAKKLKEESKCLKIKRQSDQVVISVMQKLLKLEEEFRKNERCAEGVDNCENSAVGEKDDKDKKREDSSKDESVQKGQKKEKERKDVEKKKKNNIGVTTTAKFIKKEVELRKRDLCSKRPSNAINIPFTIKKVLTDEWEVISQCGMLHKLPATVSVMDALNAYHDGKIQMLRNNGVQPSNGHSTIIEEKKEEEKQDSGNDLSTLSTLQRDTISGSSHGIGSDDSSNIGEGGTVLQAVNNAAEQEWKDMTLGLAMYFDLALPKQLLYRHELPQHIVMEKEHPDKRYCELYPCEHLLRLCLKLPDLVDSASDMTEEEKSKIMFKTGDFVRFLQKHQNMFLLQRYRKPNPEEREKAKKLQSRLGLVTTVKPTELKEGEDNIYKSEGSEHEEIKRKRKRDRGQQRKKRKLTD